MSMFSPYAQITTVIEVVPSPAVTEGRMYLGLSKITSIAADVFVRALAWGSVRVVQTAFEGSDITLGSFDP